MIEIIWSIYTVRRLLCNTHHLSESARNTVKITRHYDNKTQHVTSKQLRNPEGWWSASPRDSLAPGACCWCWFVVLGGHGFYMHSLTRRTNKPGKKRNTERVPVPRLMQKYWNGFGLFFISQCPWSVSSYLSRPGGKKSSSCPRIKSSYVSRSMGRRIRTCGACMLFRIMTLICHRQSERRLRPKKKQ